MNILSPEKVLEKLSNLGAKQIIRHTLMHLMLTPPLRDWVISFVKKPLFDAIISAGTKFNEKFGDVESQNLTFGNTKVLIEAWEDFFNYENNPARNKLFRALKDITVSEYEHDYYYAFRFNFFLELLIIAVLKGKWKTRPENTPSTHWRAVKPYGGEYTIIAEIQKHREEIIDILGDKWSFLKGGNDNV